MKLLTSFGNVFTRQSQSGLVRSNNGCSGGRSKKCDEGQKVVYSSLSYLADAARKWKIMSQIQGAQDPWNGSVLLQVFGSVTHVPSSISEERNKNWTPQIYAEEALSLFHSLQLVRNHHTSPIRHLPKPLQRCALAIDCLARGYCFFTHLSSTGRQEWLLGSEANNTLSGSIWQ